MQLSKKGLSVIYQNQSQKKDKHNKPTKLCQDFSKNKNKSKYFFNYYSIFKLNNNNYSLKRDNFTSLLKSFK